MVGQGKNWQLASRRLHRRLEAQRERLRGALCAASGGPQAWLWDRAEVAFEGAAGDFPWEDVLHAGLVLEAFWDRVSPLRSAGPGSACAGSGRWLPDDDAIGQVRSLLAADLETLAIPRAADGGTLLSETTQFFEQYLAVRDGRRRRALGAYFTPWELVDYLVNSALGIVQSLSEPAVWVDPACGTGIFLGRALQLGADARPHDTWRGMDLSAECCLAATLLLEELERLSGNSGAATRRWQIGWRNSLACRRIEGDAPLVIFGNPPFGNFVTTEAPPWNDQLLRTYKQGLAERKLNLTDDLIRFLRWAHYQLDQRRAGVIAMVTSNTFLRGLTHRQMRRSLCASFDEIYLLDLRGDLKQHRASEPPRDENVFEIQQGVALCLFIKRERPPGLGPRPPAHVHFAELSGSRAEKLDRLRGADLSQIRWSRLQLSTAKCLFSPADDCREYESWPSLANIFRSYISGVQTKCDRFFIDPCRAALSDRVATAIRHARAPEFGNQEDLPSWLRQRLATATFDPGLLQPILVAPFDRRWYYCDPKLLGRARWSVMRHMVQENLGLVFMRQSTNQSAYDHLLATNCAVTDRVFYSARGAPFIAPLWLYEGERRVSNILPAFFDRVFDRVFDQRQSASAIRSDRGAAGCERRAEEELLAFGYLYGLLSSSTYRTRYRRQLAEDFPRVPVPAENADACELARVGKLLAACHSELCVNAQVKRYLQRECHAGQCIPSSDQTVAIPRGFPKFTETAPDIGQLALNQSVRWEGFPRAPWKLSVGGYPVLPRWLKQRRQLTPALQTQFADLVTLLAAADQLAAIGDELARRVLDNKVAGTLRAK